MYIVLCMSRKILIQRLIILMDKIFTQVFNTTGFKLVIASDGTLVNMDSQLKPPKEYTPL